MLKSDLVILLFVFFKHDKLYSASENKIDFIFFNGKMFRKFTLFKKLAGK